MGVVYILLDTGIDIPYLLKNGFKIIENEYQVILKKIN